MGMLMESPDAVESALSRVETISQNEHIACLKRSEMLQGLIDKAEALMSKLFGVEEATKQTVRKQIEEWQHEKSRMNLYANGYRLLDMHVLSWRDVHGWPRLGLFNLRNDALRISSSGAMNCLHGPLRSYYEDVCQRLQRMAKDDWHPDQQREFSLHARFAGVIPDPVREHIFRAKPDFQEIFILAEVKAWEVNCEVQPVPRDPIVAGFDGKCLWFVDAFDVTPIEHYIKSEFTA